MDQRGREVEALQTRGSILCGHLILSAAKLICYYFSVFLVSFVLYKVWVLVVLYL